MEKDVEDDLLGAILGVLYTIKVRGSEYMSQACLPSQSQDQSAQESATTSRHTTVALQDVLRARGFTVFEFLEAECAVRF